MNFSMQFSIISRHFKAVAFVCLALSILGCESGSIQMDAGTSSAEDAGTDASCGVAEYPVDPDAGCCTPRAEELAFEDRRADSDVSMYVNASVCSVRIVRYDLTTGVEQTDQVSLSVAEAERTAEAHRTLIRSEDLSRRTPTDLAVDCSEAPGLFPPAVVSVEAVDQWGPDGVLPRGECVGPAYAVSYVDPLFERPAEAIFSRDSSQWTPETAELISELSDVLDAALSRVP
ncbi:MAG: hypothetical protein KC543_07240 [Myxococcales bacterium]|nr:hypothetical protein [Myxococcales bacterium]